VLEASVFIYINLRVAQNLIANEVVDRITKIFNTGGSAPKVKQTVQKVYYQVTSSSVAKKILATKKLYLHPLKKVSVF